MGLFLVWFLVFVLFCGLVFQKRECSRHGGVNTSPVSPATKGCRVVAVGLVFVVVWLVFCFCVVFSAFTSCMPPSLTGREQKICSLRVTEKVLSSQGSCRQVLGRNSSTVRRWETTGSFILVCICIHFMYIYFFNTYIGG